MDTWHTWELVLPRLERFHEVLAPTFVGHAGGPALDGKASARLLADAIERAMDEAGFESAHFAGSSLGGYVALQLAERDRARSVVAIAPAGGWTRRMPELFARQRALHAAAPAAAARIDSIVATREGRRSAMQLMVERVDHIPDELIAFQLLALARCDGAPAFLDFIEDATWPLDPARILCPLRFVWGTRDRLVPWPKAAERYRASFPHADWIELDDVGHYPQLDVPAETADLILGLTAR